MHWDGVVGAQGTHVIDELMGVMGCSSIQG